MLKRRQEALAALETYFGRSIGLLELFCSTQARKKQVANDDILARVN